MGAGWLQIQYFLYAKGVRQFTHPHDFISPFQHLREVGSVMIPVSQVRKLVHWERVWVTQDYTMAESGCKLMHLIHHFNSLQLTGLKFTWNLGLAQPLIKVGEIQVLNFSSLRNGKQIMTNRRSAVTEIGGLGSVMNSALKSFPGFFKVSPFPTTEGIIGGGPAVCLLQRRVSACPHSSFAGK